MKKTLEWSYPTSPNAERAGMSRTGCWTISVGDGVRVSRVVSHHANPSEALAAADAMGEPWAFRTGRDNALRAIGGAE